MGRIIQQPSRAETAPVPPRLALVWEAQGAPARGCGHDVPHRDPVEPGVAFDPAVGSFLRSVGRSVGRWSAVFIRPTFLQLHGRSPMETSRIANVCVADATDLLERSPVVEWIHGNTAGRLLLEPFRTVPGALGEPRVADAIICGHNIRRLRVTVSVYRYGTERCGIQIHPRYRRPRTARRLRHCLSSTHGAADRLRDLVLAVDFMPPSHGSTGVSEPAASLRVDHH